MLEDRKLVDDIPLNEEQKIDHDDNTTSLSIESPPGLCNIFYNLLFFTVISSSFSASCLIGLQYLDVFISNASQTTVSVSPDWQLIPYAVFILVILSISWTCIWCSFLSKYNSFIFNEQVTKAYDMDKIIDRSTKISCGTSCLAWTTIFVIWMVYFFINLKDFVNELDNETDIDTDEINKEALEWVNKEMKPLLSDIDSPYYWSIGLLMSPVWIFFISYFMIMMITCYKMRGRNQSRVSINSNREILINEYVSNDANSESKWDLNKRLLRNVVIVQFLSLVTWVFWRWLTAPFLDISYGDEVHYTFRRNNPLLSYWVLYGLTTAIKYLSLYLVGSIKSPNDDALLFKQRELKMTIKIMTSILFAFGLKFVFTNIKEWEKFIGVTIMHCVFNIFVNGSLQSHQYGKKFMNSIKRYINNKCLDKCCCCISKRIPITDFNDIEEIKKYNYELAIGLSLHFIVSASSCLIMMVYFGMLMGSLNAQIDNKVFEFMAASFGVDCIIIFFQILVFKKRDRHYFFKLDSFKHCGTKFEKVVEIVGQAPAYEFDPDYVWIDILHYSLLLAWFWIGGITGAPVDVKT